MTQSETLNDLLERWHNWAKSYRPVAGCGTSAIFKNTKSSRSWDTNEQILDDEIEAKIMQAIDFNVSEIAEPYRTCIHFCARNMATGRDVWMSPRIPADIEQRAKLMAEAREILSNRLINAGVL